MKPTLYIGMLCFIVSWCFLTSNIPYFSYALFLKVLRTKHDAERVEVATMTCIAVRTERTRNARTIAAIASTNEEWTVGVHQVSVIAVPSDIAFARVYLFHSISYFTYSVG